MRKSIWNVLTSLSIYPKLVLTFLLVLSPLYAIGWKMNITGSSQVQKEVSASLQSRASLYMRIFEFDLDRIVRLLQEYVNDDDLLRLTSSSEVMTDIEKMQAQLRLKSRLDFLKKSSAFVEDAIAFVPVMNRSISANANIITNLDREQMAALTRSTNRFEEPFIVWHDRLFISLPYPDPAIANGSEQVFLLAVEISRSELESVLAEFTGDSGGAALAGKSFTIASRGSDADLMLSASQFLKEGALSEAAVDDLTAIRQVTLKEKPYVVVSKESLRRGITLLMYVESESVTAPLNVYRSWFYVLSIVSVLIIFLFSYSIYYIIHQPLKKLVRSFRRVEQGNLNLEVDYPLKDEFGYLYDQFNGMMKRLNVLVHQVYEQQYRARLAELRHLQSQINPHFLYNSYFILYRMAMQKDHESVATFTKHLGEYFQYMTRDGAEVVPLRSEVHHARTYAEIQSIRFAGRIDLHFDEPPDDMLDIPVPRLIIQPIIENAYNHGLENKRRGGMIRVSFASLTDRIEIAVEDNGDEMSEEKLKELKALLFDQSEPAESTGLVNVHRRILIRSGGEGGLSLALGEERGLKVTINLPRQVSLYDPTADRR